MTEPTRIDLGDEIRIDGTFRDSASALADPDHVYIKTHAPSGTEVTYEYGVDVELVRSSVGQYTMLFTPDESSSHDPWLFRLVGVGSVTQADETELWVDTDFTSP